MEKEKHHHQAGFTLLEILIVVAIIGLLAGIAAVRFGDNMEDVRFKTTKMNIKNLHTAIKLFELQVMRRPKNLEELIFEGDENWPGPFIEEDTLPKDGWDKDYKMFIQGKRLKIRSAGPDGVYDTQDDIIG